MTGRDFPAEVLGWEFSAQDTGPADFYKKDGNLISADFVEGMDYDDAISRVSEQAPAGTGVCGVKSGTGIVCYLRATDGLVVLSADTMDVPLEDLVVFANEITAQLGTE